MQRWNRRRFGWLSRAAPLVIAAWSVVAMAQPAAADAGAQFGIRPANPSADGATSGYFVLHAQPGETLHEAVIVANPGAVPITVQVYPVAATTDQSSGAVYLNRDDPRTDVAAWISPASREVGVAPAREATVDFTVAVPPGARAGQHSGAIAAQLSTVAGPAPSASPANQQNTGFGVTTVTRAVTAVLLTVGQAGTPSLTITGAQMRTQDGSPTLTLSLRSDGTALVKAHGEVTMTDDAGATVLRFPLKLDTIVPGTAIVYPVQADPPTRPGTYRVHASLDFGGVAPAVFDGSVVVTVAASSPTVVVIGGRRHAAPAPPVAAASTRPASVGVPTLVAILGSMTGTLLIVAMGLTVYVKRSRGGARLG